MMESSRGRGQLLGITEAAFKTPDVRIVNYGTLWKSSRGATTSAPTISLKKPADHITAKLTTLSHDCWDELGLCGYARFVFRTDQSGKMHLIDVVTNPSLAEKGAFLNTARLNDWPPEDVVSAIAEGAIARHTANI